jgi:hypothetical protein
MSSSPQGPSTNPTRELAAIMFSDVVGYTAIMGRDAQQALRALKDHRELLRLLLPKFNGRMVGEIGDGTLSSFHSAIDAVNCARGVQASLLQDQPDLKVRIGIHLGDVVFSNNTVLGYGVNVASRLHALAPPGGRRDPQQAGNPRQRPRGAEPQKRVPLDASISDRRHRTRRTADSSERAPAPVRTHSGRGRCDIGRTLPRAHGIEIASPCPTTGRESRETNH